MAEPISGALVLDLLQQLMRAFPRSRGESDVTGLASVYRTGLYGLSGESLRWAVSTAIQEDEYFPKVARLRELANRWQKVNRREVEAQIVRPSGWCDGCQTVAKPEGRWRPKWAENRREFLRDEAGRLGLEWFERIRCRCDAPPKYFPDAENDDFMTEPGTLPPTEQEDET